MHKFKANETETIIEYFFLEIQLSPFCFLNLTAQSVFLEQLQEKEAKAFQFRSN